MCETETETEITPLVHCGASGFIMHLYEILESARHDRTNLLPEMPEKEHAPPTECCGGAVRDLGGWVDGWVDGWCGRNGWVEGGIARSASCQSHKWGSKL